MFGLRTRDIEDLSIANSAWNVVKVGFGCDNRHHRVEGNSMAVFGGVSFDAAPACVFPADDVTLEYSVLFPSFFRPTNGLLPGLTLGSASICVEWSDTTVRVSALDKTYDTPLLFTSNGWNGVSLRVKLNSVGEADGLVSLTIDGRSSSEDKLVLRTDPSVLLTAARIETTFESRGDRVLLFKDFSLSLHSKPLGASGHRGNELVAPEPVQSVDDEVEDRGEESKESPQQAVAVALVRDARDPEVEDEVQEHEEET